MSEQIAVRVPEALLSMLDDLVRRGVYDSRAAAVRAGVEAVVELDRRLLTDRAIVDGYRRRPPTDAERDAATASMRAAIAEEPW
ncbi:MAG: ribbon-helix-helix domain-containing protein [Acidimicrobiales bacterium]